MIIFRSPGIHGPSTVPDTAAPVTPLVLRKKRLCVPPLNPVAKNTKQQLKTAVQLVVSPNENCF